MLAFRIFVDICCLVGYLVLFVRYVRWGLVIWRNEEAPAVRNTTTVWVRGKLFVNRYLVPRRDGAGSRYTSI